jgi:hypothetical protein
MLCARDRRLIGGVNAHSKEAGANITKVVAAANTASIAALPAGRQPIHKAPDDVSARRRLEGLSGIPRRKSRRWPQLQAGDSYLPS